MPYGKITVQVVRDKKTTHLHKQKGPKKESIESRETKLKSEKVNKNSNWKDLAEIPNCQARQVLGKKWELTKTPKSMPQIKKKPSYGNE